MSDPIKVGDLVQVVRPRTCVCGGVGFGKIFRVSKLMSNWTRCITCGDTSNSGKVEPLAGVLENDTWIELRRLKRIPPLDELEGRRTEENLKVPA